MPESSLDLLRQHAGAKGEPQVARPSLDVLHDAQHKSMCNISHLQPLFEAYFAQQDGLLMSIQSMATLAARLCSFCDTITCSWLRNIAICQRYWHDRSCTIEYAG